MKRTQITFAVAVTLVAALTSCQKNAAKEGTMVNVEEMQLYEYDDSTKQALVDLHVTLPTATDSASTQVRDSILEHLYRFVSEPGITDGTPRMARYSGLGNDYQAIINYYGKSLLDSYTAESLNEYEDMEGSEGWEKPAWGTSITISPANDSVCFGPNDAAKYILFDATAYYYLGGAHGSYITDNLCFRFSDGALFTQFFADSVTTAMQPLLKKGLMEYFKTNDVDAKEEDFLLYLSLPEPGDVIPLPVTAPCPTRKGLLFTYQQYEIACYAAGMPSFILPYEEVMPYLTDAAKDLLVR